MRRLAAAAFAVGMAASCGGTSPTSPLPGGPAPVPAAASFEGVWRFEYRTEQCAGDRNCFAILGRTADFSVRLMRAGSAYAGVVLLSGANVDVTGLIDPSGTLILTGVRPAAVEYDTRVEIKRLALRHDEGTLTGDVEIVAESPYHPYGEWRRGGPLVSATQAGRISDSPTSDFTGTWTGTVAERRCLSNGLENCNSFGPLDVKSFELTLTGAGGSVTGVLNGPRAVSIEGTIAGATLLAQGLFEERGTTGLVRITTVRPSSLTRDALGRLKGALSVEVRSTLPDGEVFSNNYRLELIDVALRPPS